MSRDTAKMLESRQHVHGGGGASMTMSPPGVPTLFYMQQIFWAFIGTALAVATLVNVFNVLLYRQRMAAMKHNQDAAKPKSLIFRIQATITAIVREYSYYSVPLSIRKWRVYLPPLGPVTMMVGYIVLITVASLYRLNPKDFLQWEDIGYRSGYIAVCQIPLIVLLGGKRNLVGFFTGVGYERLNWLHRWVARGLLFTVLIHMGYWMSEWDKFDYIMVKIKGDVLTRRGIAAGSILAWMVVSSIAPIRGLSYEIFVIQHIVSFAGFLAAVYLHVPARNQIWVWLPVAFWAFDRVVRAGYMLYNNLAIFHKSSSGVLACRATFEPLDDSHTRITIANPPVSWKAGQHMFLACHPLAPLSSHPFTIASLPEDGKIEFVVRAKKGATRKFHRYAGKINSGLPSTSVSAKTDRGVLLEGPYSRIRPLRQFDSVVFVAGSTGATFTVPLMRDIVRNWKGSPSKSASRFSFEPAPGAVTRHIKFVWCLKRSTSVSWFATQLDQVVADVESLRNDGHDIAVDMTIYVTCDDELTSARSSAVGQRPQARDRTQELPEASDFDEKKEAGISQQEIRVSSRSSSIRECCCTRTVEENELRPPCQCGTALVNQRVSPGSSIVEERPKRCVDEQIQILSGRPNVANIVRKVAELARGEMAVVVCGPPGMVQSTRNAVVAISDERAVHKGTGAQGIYVHAEAFGYA